MRVGINLGGFLYKDKGWQNMVEMLFQHMAKNWPQHQFVFITDTIGENIDKFNNISAIVLPNTSKNGLVVKFWLDYKLPSFLKKNKIDLLINPDGVCSLSVKIPQILLVKDLRFLQPKPKANGYAFVLKRFKSSLEKAKAVVVFNHSTLEIILEKYAPFEGKIISTNYFADSFFQPIDWRKKESVKNELSAGNEYFLYSMDDSSIDPLVILKAFSLFKKRQQSNMQLLMVGKITEATNFLSTKMTTYKYRNDVKILGTLPKSETANLLAASYCVLYFSNIELELPFLNVMQIGVPIIVLTTDLVPKARSAAILYADANNAEAIAEQMKTIYKDENLRNRMVVAGLGIAESNAIEKTANETWSAIAKPMKGVRPK